MFLYTGLFITAHDAMHGSVYPQHPRLNDWIGTIAVFCYATFSYQELLEKHRLHHRHPASEQDPDFHDGEHQHPVAWYFHFMRQYWGWKQFVILSILFQLGNHLLHIPQSNLALFWVIPPILSSVQLFYFGTFLTHRESEAGYADFHRARTTPLPPLWSFMTCYHFGYHREHHEHPHLTWWQLPAAYRNRIRARVASISKS
jgi:beta-carotene ketolase (CrtW type)